MVGSLTIPLMGWGAAYIFAAGLWLLVASVAPAGIWIVAAIIFRLKSGQWQFGMDDDEP